MKVPTWLYWLGSAAGVLALVAGLFIFGAEDETTSPATTDSGDDGDDGDDGKKKNKKKSGDGDGDAITTIEDIATTAATIAALLVAL